MPRSTYEFQTEISERHLNELHVLYQGEWWTRGRTLDEVKTMLERSNLVFALCDTFSGRLVAFARVLTDGIFKAFIFDVIVAPDVRNEGLGKRLMEAIANCPDLKDVRHLELYCLPELVPFYEKLGFSTDVSGVRLMRKRNIKDKT